MYLCIFCNYYTDKKDNYIRHVKTKKHLDIVKKTLDDSHKNYICGICKYKTDKKSNYFCHINLCLMKNFNKTFQTNYKEDIIELKNKFKTEKKKLQFSINKLNKKNNFFMKIFKNLIEEDYIDERVLNNKNVFSSNDKTQMIEYLRIFFENNTNKEKFLNDIKHQISNNITTIYLSNTCENECQKESKKESISITFSESGSEYNSDSDSEDLSDYESTNDYSSDSISDIDLNDNVNNLKQITDCGRIYFYDNNNIVFNINNERIGIRVHDEYCPREHNDNNYTDKCWWYVEYDKK